MGDILLRGCQLAVALFEMWLCYQYLYMTVLDRSFLDKKEKLIVWGNIAVISIMLSINRMLLFFSHIMFMICIIVTSICVICIVRRNVILNIGFVALYFALVSLLDFLFAFICMFFVQQQFGYKVYYTSSYLQVIIFLFSRIIILGCLWVIEKKKIIEADIEEYRNILLLGSITFFIILRLYQNILCDMTNGDLQMKAGSASFSLVVLMTIVVFIEIVLLKNQTIRKENEFLLSRDEMVEKKYREMAELIARNRELVHDINNHLIILDGYAKEENCEKIRLYLKKINQNLFRGDIKIWTGNKTLDMILSQKKSISKQKGISFEVYSIPVSELPFSDNELCALFGNLLDNALEACGRMEGSNRWISVKIERQNKLLFIEVSNSIEEKPVEKNGSWISSKEDKSAHGYGLKSVNRIVERYGGVSSYRIKENSFNVNLSFFDMEDTSYNNY